MPRPILRLIAHACMRLLHAPAACLSAKYEETQRASPCPNQAMPGVSDERRSKAMTHRSSSVVLKPRQQHWRVGFNGGQAVLGYLSSPHGSHLARCKHSIGSTARTAGSLTCLHANPCRRRQITCTNSTFAGNLLVDQTEEASPLHDCESEAGPRLRFSYMGSHGTGTPKAGRSWRCSVLDPCCPSTQVALLHFGELPERSCLVHVS